MRRQARQTDGTFTLREQEEAYKTSLLPARDSWHGRGLSHRRLRSQWEKSSLSPFFPTSPTSTEPYAFGYVGTISGR
jgi:hypothetical protein